jgi:hypothetical protein
VSTPSGAVLCDKERSSEMTHGHVRSLHVISASASAAQIEQKHWCKTRLLAYENLLIVRDLNVNRSVDVWVQDVHHLTKRVFV